MGDTSDAGGPIAVTIGAGTGLRLDKALARDLPPGTGLSRSRLARMIAEGLVRRGGQVVRDPGMKVHPGEVVLVTPAPPVAARAGPQAIPLDVIHEDDDLIVIDKPAGMVVHPAPGAPCDTLVNALLHHCGARLSGVGGVLRPGIVHRLDKDTSGVMVVAKSDRAHHGLAAQFEARSVARRYLALVHGCPDPADARLAGLTGVGWEPGGVLRIATRLGRHRTDRQRQAVLATGGRHAVTRALALDTFGRPVAAAALLACWLETGRTHQIRVHMAHVGHGILGDPVYGGQRRVSARALGPAAVAAVAGFARQALHAETLGFVHPVTGARLDFRAPMPADMAALLGALRGQG